MKRSVKITLGSVAALLVFLLALAMVIPSFLDWNQYKTEIENAARSATGRDVRVNGDISLSILPAPALTAADVTVANIKGGSVPDMVRLERLEVRISLLPLLRSHIQIEKVVLVKPVIVLERLADGRINWDFAAAGKAEQPTQTNSLMDDVRLDRFLIENGDLTFTDHKTGESRQLTGLDAVVSAETLEGPYRASGDLKVRNVPVGFEFSMGKSHNGNRVPATLTLNLPNAGGSLKANGIVSPDGSPLFDGKLESEGSDFSKLLSDIGRAVNVASLAALTGDVQSFSLEADVSAGSEAFKLDNLDFRIGDTKGNGQATFMLGDRITGSASLSVNSLELDSLLAGKKAGPAEPVDVEALAQNLNMDIPANITADLDLTVNAAKYRGGIIRQLVFRAKADGGKVVLDRASALMPGGADVALSGILTSKDKAARFDGKLKGSFTNLRAFLTWLDMMPQNVPADRLANFSIDSTVSLTSKLAQIYGINASLDTSRITGGIAYALRSRPSFTVDLDIDRLDMDAYLPTKKEANKEAAETMPEIHLANMLGPLNDFDANFILKVGQFTYNRARGQALDLDATLAGGTLLFKKLKITDYAGAELDISGKIAKLGNNPRLDLAYHIQSRDPSRFTRYFKLDLPVPVERLGPLDLNGKVAGPVAIMDISNTVRMGATTGSISGSVKTDDRQGIPKLKNYGLTVNLKNPSLAGAIHQFGLDISPPGPGDDRAVAVSGLISGRPSAADMDITVEVAGGSVKLNGDISGLDEKPQYEFTVNAKSPETLAFIRGLGMDYQPAAKKLGALALNTSLRGDTKQIILPKLTGTVGSLGFTASGNLDTSGDRPRLAVTMTAGTILLDNFLPPPQGGLSDGRGTGSKDRWSREVIDTSALKAMDADIKISAKGLNSRGYMFNNPRFTLKLEDGNLWIKDLAGQLFGGDVAISASFVGKKTHDLKFDLSLADGSLEQALKTAAGIGPAIGNFSLKGNFVASGASQYALMSSLGGMATLSATKGILQGIDLPKLSKQIGKIKGLEGFLRIMGAALSGGQTAYQAFDTKIEASKGVIQIRDMTVALDAGKALLNARVNLPNWRVDSKGRLILTEHPKAPPLGVDITGLVDNPKITYQTAELKNFVAAQIGKALLQNAVGKGDGLDQLLKGGSPSGQTPPDGGGTIEEKKKIDPAKMLLDQLFKQMKGIK